MKPGVTTSEFGVAAAVIAATLSGVSNTDQQLIAGILAGVYVLGRAIVKAAAYWRSTSPPVRPPAPPVPPVPPGPQA